MAAAGVYEILLETAKTDFCNTTVSYKLKLLATFDSFEDAASIVSSMLDENNSEQILIAAVIRVSSN